MNPRPLGDSKESPLWKFYQSLKASRLLSVDQLVQCERRAAELPFAAFCQSLLDEGILTDYQLKRVRSGQTDGLVYGPYRVLGELGTGGCGRVYRGRHHMMDRDVAIKVIGEDLAASGFTRDMFIREVMATTRLNHPNIASAYHADECNGAIFLVIEYVEGPTLQTYLDAGGPIGVILACSILGDCARGLQHALDVGIVHRDIKPANIMLPGLIANRDSGPLAKLVDFGLARMSLKTHGAGRTLACQDGAIVGTPAFMAPEQIYDFHTADIRSDLYSLGCTIYYALSGKLPFKGSSPDVTLYLQLHEDCAPLRSHRPDVPPRVARLIHQMLSKNPAARPSTPALLLEELNDVLLSGDLCEPTRSGRIPAPPERAESTRTPMDVGSSLNPCDPGCSVLGLAPVVAPIAVVATDDESLRTLWEDWSGTIDRLVGGELAGRTPNEYREVHKQLLAAIRERSGDAGFASVAETVEPWVTLESLMRLDRRMLASLMEQIERCDAVMAFDAEPPSDSWIFRMFGGVFGT